MKQPSPSPASAPGTGKLGADSFLLSHVLCFLWTTRLAVEPKVDAEYRKPSSQKPCLLYLYSCSTQTDTGCRGSALALSSYPAFEIFYLFGGTGGRETHGIGQGHRAKNQKKKKPTQKSSQKPQHTFPTAKYFDYFKLRGRRREKKEGKAKTQNGIL